MSGTCPRDGKKLRAGRCIVCGHRESVTVSDAPTATRTPPPVASPTPPPTAWRGRSTRAGGPAAAPEGRPASGSSAGQGAAAGGLPPRPVAAGGSSEPLSSVAPLRGAVVLHGTISEVSPERHDTVRLGAGSALGRVNLGLVTAVPRVFFLGLAIVVRLLLPRLGGLAAGGVAGGRGRYGPADRDEAVVPGTPFRLRVDDQVHDCYLRGEVRGGAVRLGDEVEVRGRVHPRSRVLEVKQLVSVRTGAVTRGFVDPRARTARARAVAQAVLLLVFVLFAIGLLRACSAAVGVR